MHRLACRSTAIAAVVLMQSLVAQVDHRGTDFTIGFLPNDFNGEFSLQAVEVHLTTETGATVEVFYPAASTLPIATVTVTPGSVEVVPLGADAANLWAEDAISANAIRLSGLGEFAAYAVNRDVFTSDVALAIPNDALGTEYIVADYPDSVLGSQFLIYAVENATTVTVTPTTTLVGRPAGVPFSILLNAGEGYYGLTATAGVSATGTIVMSDKPVGVASGSYCATIPSGVDFCDHVYEVAEPVSSWGQDFVLANLPQRLDGTIYRFVASENATNVMLDGVLTASLQRGQFFETAPLAGDHVVSSDRPIAVVQYMTGDESPGATDGDPAMGYVVPLDRFASSYTVGTIDDFQFTSQYFMLTVADGDIGAVTIDGATIAFSRFDPVGNGFSTARILVAPGVHTTSAPSPHGLTVAGYGFNNSYLFSGGAVYAVAPNIDPFPPTCDVTFDLTTNTFLGLATDDGLGEDLNDNRVLDLGEDVNLNGLLDVQSGVASVALSADSTNVFLDVAPFATGAEQVSFSVAQLDSTIEGSGTVVVIDGAGNETSCPVVFTAESNDILGDPAVDVRRGNQVFPWPFGPEVVGIAGFLVEIIEDETDGDFARVTVTDLSQGLPECGQSAGIDTVFFNFSANLVNNDITVLDPSTGNKIKRNRSAGVYGTFDIMTPRSETDGSDFVFEVRLDGVDIVLEDFEPNALGFRFAAGFNRICMEGVGSGNGGGPNGKAFSGTL